MAACIYVFSQPYTLDDEGKVQVQWAVNNWKLFRRLKPLSKPLESLVAMQKRIEEQVVDLQREQVSVT